MLKEIKAKRSGERLLKRETSQPEMGSPAIELMGMASSKLPNSASLKLKTPFIVGMREAQVEKLKPIIKK